jgi:hypothetical protein
MLLHAYVNVGRTGGRRAVTAYSSNAPMGEFASQHRFRSHRPCGVAILSFFFQTDSADRERPSVTRTVVSIRTQYGEPNESRTLKRQKAPAPLPATNIAAVCLILVVCRSAFAKFPCSSADGNPQRMAGGC